MTGEQYGEDTQKMLVAISLLEAQIKCVDTNTPFDGEAWLATLDERSLGRIMLDRKIVKMFFGGGPKGINQRTRKELIALMLKVKESYPQLMGDTFQTQLDDLMKREVMP